VFTGADSIRVMRPLFQAGEGGSTPTSALSLFFRPIDLDTARALNRLWHSRLPRFGRPVCRVAYVAEWDGLAYAVAIWTNPLARLLPQREWLELNRMAVAPDAPRNTASRMLAWMARDARERFQEVAVLVSYQDTEVHTGVIYRAAGWRPTVLTKFRTWAHRAHYIRDYQEPSKVDKQRWEKRIR
jgi:hypothetical protein